MRPNLCCPPKKESMILKIEKKLQIYGNYRSVFKNHFFYKKFTQHYNQITLKMNISTLTLFLASFLVEFSELEHWVLCPGSLNCLCLTNITSRIQFIPKCVNLEDLEEHCPSHVVSLYCYIINETGKLFVCFFIIQQYVFVILI